MKYLVLFFSIHFTIDLGLSTLNIIILTKKIASHGLPSDIILSVVSLQKLVINLCFGN